MTPKEKIELEPIAKRIPVKKHRLFIDELFKCNMNQSKAYCNVYDCEYNNARARSSDLVAKGNISEEIERRLKEQSMSADEVLMRLAAQARGDIGDLADIGNSTDLAEHPLSPIVKKYKKKVYHPQNGEAYDEVELELYDAHAALVDIGKRHSLFSDRVEHTGKDGGLIQFDKIVINMPEDE